MAKTSTEKVTPCDGGGRPNGTLVSDKNMFYTTFEPKTRNRFMVHLYHPKTKEHLIEPFLIKYIDRPSYTRFNGKKHWHTIRLRMYESIVPQYVLFKCLGAGVFNLQVDELGSIGYELSSVGQTAPSSISKTKNKLRQPDAPHPTVNHNKVHRC